MRARHLVAALISIALLASGLTCQPPAKITIVSPGSLVSTFDFVIEVQLTHGWFDLNTLDISLNFTPLSFTPGTTVVIPMGPGDPLRDENMLIVRAVRNGDGKIMTAGRAFDYLPSKARAFEITDPGDLLSGPLAHGRVGDYMLKNAEAQFVIQGVGEGAGLRDLYSVGGFGGNIIDALLDGQTGLENFLEIQPMLNLETVINATSLEVLNDGQNGEAAVIRTCGPDDLLDFVNPSSQLAGAGLVLPPGVDDTDHEIEACTSYILEPLVPYVRMETEITNLLPVPEPPDPPEANDLPLLVGDWVNGGGELEQWAAPGYGLGQSLFGSTTGGLDTLSFFGYGEAEGVDYSYTTVETPAVPGVGSDYFSVSGVTIVLHNASIMGILLGGSIDFIVPAGQSRSITRYFGVGDGSGANAVDMKNEVKSIVPRTLQGCVTVDGVPAPGARVAVIQRPPVTTSDELRTHFVTDENGCYQGTLPTHYYWATAARAGTPYIGGGTSPDFGSAFALNAASSPLTKNFDLPATGRLRVEVVDEQTPPQPIPARVTVVGFDPSPEPIQPGVSLLGFSGTDLGTFNDPSDFTPFGVTRSVYTGADGIAEFDLEPKAGADAYRVYVSRGTEYGLWVSPATVEIAANTLTTLNARIARVLDTSGFISSDFHVHGIRSADARVSDTDRVKSFAGEGIENPVATDHHTHTDLKPRIAALGLGDWLTSTIGEEITTFDYGHFNAYPLTIDPDKPSGGSTDWAVGAPPGDDFPSDGSYQLGPQGIFDLATMLSPQAIPGTTAAQINHIDDHFQPLKIDSSQTPPTSFLTLAEKLALRLEPVAGNLFAVFDALEVWNGYDRGHQSEFLDQRIGIWFNHLNQDIRIPAVAGTDSHTLVDLRTAGARTWTASPTGDLPADIDSADVAGAVIAGKAVGGQGVYVQTRLITAGGIADLTDGGTNTVASSDGNVTLEVKVQSPTWAEWDRIEIYANHTPVPNGSVPVDPSFGMPGDVVNVLYTTGTPEALLVEGDCDPATTDDTDGGDFDIETVNVVSLAGVDGDRYEATVSVPFTVAEDTWFVAIVKGTDGVCKPMFPVYPEDIDDTTNATLDDLLDENVGEAGVMALGFANPLYFEKLP